MMIDETEPPPLRRIVVKINAVPRWRPIAVDVAWIAGPAPIIASITALALWRGLAVPVAVALGWLVAAIAGFLVGRWRRQKRPTRSYRGRCRWVPVMQFDPPLRLPFDANGTLLVPPPEMAVGDWLPVEIEFRGR